ncbi:MAG: alpha/beta hydrolase [Verrucomicrobiota bacterium]|nr:alpha/beta hydrolase [Verrucomicrobiota bacterium]
MSTKTMQVQLQEKRLRWLITIAVSVFWTHAAQPAEARRQSRPDPPDVNVQRDLVYKKANDHSLRLDIYSPKSITHPLPVILWLHGHRWRRGSKDQRPPVNFMAQGYIVVSPDYRLSGEAPFPAAIEDCKAAVRWLRANAVTYHIDPDHIGAGGHSAGGHLAALLGTSGGVAELEGDGDNSTFSSRVQAVCMMSAPADIPQFYEALSKSDDGPGRRAKTSIEQFLGGQGDQIKEKAIAASPITYVSKDDAAFLIIHGENDMSIPVDQSQAFAEKLKAAEVDVTLEIAKGRGHGVGGPNYASEITGFFDKHLKPAMSR